MTVTSRDEDLAAGCAALAICESLLLALTEAKVLDRNDVRGALEDAATVHRNANTATSNPAIHREAVQIIERIISGHSTLPRG